MKANLVCQTYAQVGIFHVNYWSIALESLHSSYISHYKFYNTKMQDFQSFHNTVQSSLWPPLERPPCLTRPFFNQNHEMSVKLVSETCLDRPPPWKEHTVCSDHFPVCENMYLLDSMQTVPVWNDHLSGKTTCLDIKGGRSR